MESSSNFIPTNPGLVVGSHRIPPLNPGVGVNLPDPATPFLTQAQLAIPIVGPAIVRQRPTPQPQAVIQAGPAIAGTVPHAVYSISLGVFASPEPGNAQAYEDPCATAEFQKSLGELLQTLSDMERFGGSIQSIDTTLEMIASLYERCPERFKEQIVGVISDETIDPDTVPGWMRDVRRILRERECNRHLRQFESLRADLGASSDPVNLIPHVCNRLAAILDALEAGCLATFKGGIHRHEAWSAAKDVRDACRRAAAGTQDAIDLVILVNAMDTLIGNFGVGGVGYGRGPK